MRERSPNPQHNALESLQRRAKKASSLLHKQYGSSTHGNKKDPLDELVFILLSLMTTHHSFNKVYNELKSSVTTWDQLLTMRVNKLSSLIKYGGLSNQKARRLIQIAKKLQDDFGKVTLAPLRKMVDADAEAYLTSLPGVGLKSAKCVLMYSLRRQVLPVDTHVWRIARRLELIDQSNSYLFVHNKLEKVVLPEDRYSFHVNAISHGRTVCIALTPRCNLCCLNGFCPFPKKNKHSQ